MHAQHFSEDSFADGVDVKIALPERSA